MKIVRSAVLAVVATLFVVTDGDAQQPPRRKLKDDLAASGTFVPIRPCRVVDTSEQMAPEYDAYDKPSLVANAIRTFDLNYNPNANPPLLGPCLDKVPASIAAYSLNVTAVSKTGEPYKAITIWAAGEGFPPTSTFVLYDKYVSNAVLVKPNAAGEVSVYSDTGADIAIDIDGYFTSNGFVATNIFPDNGSVGINKTAPMDALHIKDGGIIFEDAGDDTSTPKNTKARLSQPVDNWTIFTQNATFTVSGGWTVDDNTKPAWIVNLDGRNGYDSFNIYHLKAGSSTLENVFKIDGATGTVSAPNIQAQYQDVAELVPSVNSLTPGTVVVVDSNRINHVIESTRAYDTRAAGVISAQPGLTLGVDGPGKVKVATTGRVKVRVDTTKHSIAAGDLTFSPICVQG